MMTLGFLEPGPKVSWLSLQGNQLWMGGGPELFPPLLSIIDINNLDCLSDFLVSLKFLLCFSRLIVTHNAI